ncbi:inositol monophosphatase family protein [Ferruginivarius sediminum]|uniref:Inositol monophosphatase n=1 Tax=Ferruginivarius sediminum TaxID=2661937 RepID=A0A369TD47_9PROT|nr:inositol monophosphatase family protein [Ferruginivarius sediminum]RDD62087.1 inositol monophosphatase [Ferruginivarius sediminum]
MHVDIDAVTRIVEETANQEILPRFGRLASHEVREKAPGELVTVADEAAELRLAARLRELLPGSVVLGEESAAKDEAVMDYLAGDDPVWVIDPVDGTANFTAGRSRFASMVALVLHGETLAAWIHEPIAGKTACAERGGGAWQNGERLSVAAGGREPAKLRGTLHAGFFGSKTVARMVDSRRDRVIALRSFRCAGAEYVALARAELDFALFTKLAPWDHAPGALLVAEAGGEAKLLDGRPYGPAQRDGKGLLLAPDAASWQALYDTLLKAE